MKRLVKNLIILSTLTFLFSCGGRRDKAPEGYTKLNFTQSQVSGSGSSLNGLVIIGEQSHPGRVFSLALNNQYHNLGQDIILDNSHPWDFYVVGWSGGNHPFEGTLKCDLINNFQLPKTNDPVNINIVLNSSKCSQHNFHPTSMMTNSTVHPFKIITCDDTGFANASASGTCDTNPGDALSFKVVVPSLVKPVSTGFNVPPNAIFGECLSSLSTSVLTTNHYIPLGGTNSNGIFDGGRPQPVEIHSFTSSDCSGTAKIFLAHNGDLNTNNPDVKTYSDGSYTKLFLRAAGGGTLPNTTPTPTPSVCTQGSNSTATNYNSIPSTETGVDYIICTPTQLVNLAVHCSSTNNSACNYSFKMEWDLDLAGKTITPIGDGTHSFTGTFDGNNRIIDNLTYTSGSNRGLFGFIGNSGTVKNIEMKNIAMTGLAGSSSVIAYKNEGTIQKIKLTSGTLVTTSTGNEVGGIAGLNNGNIIGVEVNINITAQAFYLGGIAGRNYGGITQSYVGAVAISQNYNSSSATGGVIGRHENNTNAIVTDNVSHANVICSSCTSSSTSVGGFIGNAQKEVSRNLSTGLVTPGSAASVGGFIGFKFGSLTFADNYFNPTTAGNSNAYQGSGGSVSGIIGASTSTLRSQSTYANWDFATKWQIQDTVDYPKPKH